MAQTFVMTMRGTPQLYYGDEIAMVGGDDPDNRRDFPGGFPGDSVDKFSRSGRSADEESLLERQKLLARLRAEFEPLRSGKLTNLVATEHQYVYARSTANASVIVAFNNDQKPAAVEFSVADTKLATDVTLVDRLGNLKGVRVANGMIKVELPARSSAILVKK